ncbi:MAG: E3 ubiquitin ligase family protein [Gallionellaceae bacterium]|nr:E3 ubiquitin ligase family protein [Gallionellaceae bacterium]
MLVALRREYALLVTSGAQLLLLFVALQLESRNSWLACLAPMALLSLFAWLSALRRLRAVRDTPTSKIASAAQGYVELTGRGQPFGESPLLGKLSHLPCLWYRYQIERRDSEKEWQTEDKGESSDSFVLNDGSGECVVDPEQAEIVTSHHDQWQQGDYRYTEWKLVKGDRIYVIGQFHTKSGAVEFNTRAELNLLLAEWKKDMPALHARFDLNGDGELDMKEWMLARQAAKREVAKRMREAQAQPDLHVVCQPQDGKLFLISNLTPEKLSRRYLLWSWAHLMIFFGALGAIGWLLQHAGF